jgi:hypothetical protein
MVTSSKKLEYQPDSGIILKDGRPTGTIGVGGYVVLRVNGKVCYAHRLAWKLYYGSEPKTIDHINGDRSDNRIENLRDVSQSVNMQNTVHGKGCHFHKPSKSWKSSIMLKGKQIHLGYFPDSESATECYLFAKAFFHNPPRMQHA